MAEGLYYAVKQYSLSPEATIYWQNASLLVEREGGLFEDPVGLLNSNFKNISDPNEQVYGYFFGTHEHIIRIKLPDGFVPSQPMPCPPPPAPSFGGRCNLGICCDCLSDPDATIVQPEYWID